MIPLRTGLVIAGAAAGLAASAWLYSAIRDSGRQAERAAAAAVIKRKLDNATIADDAHIRCLADVRCRLSDDGFRRD